MGACEALACASGTCGQVLLYYSHEQAESGSGEPELRTLNFNKTLTSLGCGPLSEALTAKEVMAHKGGGVVPPKRGKRGSKKA